MPEANASQPYVVFARRWRPLTFDDVVGQDHISQQLKNAVTSGRVGHSFLFRGPRGVGKTSMARILARALNCEEGPTPEPCGKCSHCRNISSGSAMDVIEIDAATHTQVDQMRDILSTVSYAPAAMRFKIYIVDEVHMLSRHAFNALLKTLEEPPPAVKFIFATTDPQRIPETIRSRCQDFEFRRISTDDIVKRLDHILAQEKNVEVAEEDRQPILEALARHAEGGMRDAQVALDQLVSLTSGALTLAATNQLLGSIENKILLETVKGIQEGDTPKLLDLVNGLVESGSDLETFVKSLMQFVRDMLILKSAPSHAKLTDIPSTWMDEIQQILPTLEVATLLNVGNGLFDLSEKIKALNHTRFLLEFFLIKLTTVASAQSIDDMLRALGTGQPMPQAAPPAAPAASAPVASASAPAQTSDPLAAPPAPVAKVLKKVTDPGDTGELWAQLINFIYSQDMRLRGFLEKCKPLSSSGNLLKIGTSDRFTLRRLTKIEESSSQLTKLVEQLTGQKWDVRIVLDDSPSEPTPPPAAPTQQQTPPPPAADPPTPPEEMMEEPPKEPAPRPTRAIDLLDRYPFLRHLHQQFQCTGIRMITPAGGSNT